MGESLSRREGRRLRRRRRGNGGRPGRMGRGRHRERSSVREESVRRRELERAVGALEATTEITRAIGAETQLDRVLELIAKRARALVHAGSVLILLRERDELAVAAAAGELAAGVVGTRVPISGSASGAVLRTRQSERLVDVRARTRFDLARVVNRANGTARPARLPRPFGRRPRGVRSHRRRPGFLARGRAPPRSVRCQRSECRRDGPIRRQPGLAPEHRRRGPRASALGPRAARRDAPEPRGNQDLAGAAARATDHAAVVSLIREVIGGVDDSIHALRSIISDLRPAALDAVGTGSALESLAERIRVRGQVDVELHVDLSRESGRTTHRHPPAVEDAIYRIVQEVLTNVNTLAASRATVIVTERGDGVAIEIRDDGNGFDQDAGSDGFGLLGIRERVQLAQGTFQLTSSAGSGTTVHVHLPVPGVVEPVA